MEGWGGGAEWRTQPYMQREVGSRREGRGHTALLYSHRYRGGISVAALQRWERGERREEKEGGRQREHHISAMLSQHVNAMHVLIELETFRGHVLMGSYGLKLSSKGAASAFVHVLKSSPGLCLIRG